MCILYCLILRNSILFFNLVCFDLWTTKIMQEETQSHYMAYSFRLAARNLLYAPSHRQDSKHQCFGTLDATIRERERNVLFNDALSTFYLRLYGVRHIVKDHSDSEKGNPLPPHRLLLPINSKGSFICTIPQTG